MLGGKEGVSQTGEVGSRQGQGTPCEFMVLNMKCMHAQLSFHHTFLPPSSFMYV